MWMYVRCARHSIGAMTRIAMHKSLQQPSRRLLRSVKRVTTRQGQFLRGAANRTIRPVAAEKHWHHWLLGFDNNSHRTIRPMNRSGKTARTRIAYWRAGRYFGQTRAITMSEIVNVVESLDVRDADKVVLPESAVIGCNGVQIQLMKETVASVQTSFAVAGAAMRSASQELYHLRGALAKKKLWNQFIKSGALPISPKVAQDLANGWDKWLKDSDLSDGALINLSSRTLNRIANADPEVQMKATKMLKSGKKVTEKMADDWIQNIDFEYQGKVTTIAKKASEVDTLKARIKELEDENAQLKQKLAAF